MTLSLLTVIVPTYNRVDSLRRLLNVLTIELAGAEAVVDVIIGDNASIDETPSIIAEFVAASPVRVDVLRHEANIGPERNFLACFDRANSTYIWILGDDDLPRAGLIRHIIPLLDKHQPDLLYIGSDWRKRNYDNDPHDPVAVINPVWLDQESFARSVNIFTTFISGMIVNRERYLNSFQTVPLEDIIGTSLVQLGWVLDSLRAGRLFMMIDAPHILATADNSSGYQPYRVFGANFATICSKIYGPDHRITRIMVTRAIIYHLPQLIWNTRYARVPGFSHESLAGASRHELRGYWGYWLILEPIASLPLVLARCMLLFSRVLAQTLKYLDSQRVQRVGL